MNHKMKIIWQKLIADRRRFGLFCCLLFVGLLLWARIIVIARPARTAVAEPVVMAAAAVVLTSDNKNIPVSLQSSPIKNPFSTDWNAFPVYTESTDNIIEKHTPAQAVFDGSLYNQYTLEAVMGEMVLINGKVLKVGDIVGPHNTNNPLIIEKVEGRAVTLSNGKGRYELLIAPLSH